MIKKVKQAIHYLYFVENRESQNVLLEFENFEGIHILKIKIPIIRERNVKGDVFLLDVDEGIQKRIRRIMKQHITEKTVIGAETDVGRALGIGDILFQAKKQELLNHASWIVEKLRQDVKLEEKQRGVLLLVTRKELLNRGELYALLLVAKDYYEELWIMIPELSDEIKDVVKELYEQWGVLVRFVSREDVLHVHTMMVLLDKWNEGLQVEDVKEESFAERCLKVVESYENLYTFTSVGERFEKAYNGISYQINGREVPYHFMTNGLFQNRSLCEEFPWNYVAICHVKC